MKIRTLFFKLAAVLLLISVFSSFPLWAQSNPTESESTHLGKQLLSALEEYNRVSGDQNFDMIKFWNEKQMLTDSLNAALKTARGFEADPFLDAQDKVPGILLKDVKMDEDVAKVKIGIESALASRAPHILTYIMIREGDNWKIADIDYGSTTLRKMLLSTSNPLGL